MSEKYAESFIALVQILSTMMTLQGLSEVEQDEIFAKGRAAKEARPSEDLPDA